MQCALALVAIAVFEVSHARAGEPHGFLAKPTALPAELSAFRADSTDAVAGPHALTKSPTTSVLMSLACPGLGQFHNEAYWKIPIFTGTAAVTAWLFFSNNAKFNDADAAYENALANPTTFDASRALTVREVYRDNRDLAGLFFLVTYALAAVDAYVGAHLYDFNVDEDVSLGVGPTRTQLMAVHFTVAIH